MLDKQDLQVLQEMENRILEQSAANMRVILESSIAPQFQLLAEGQNMLLAKLAPRTEVETLRDEVNFLKSVIRVHEQEIQQLKKAQ